MACYDDTMHRWFRYRKRKWYAPWKLKTVAVCGGCGMKVSR